LTRMPRQSHPDSTRGPQTASPFVRRCLEYLKPRTGVALDVPAGRGRHAALLASMGLYVVACDLDTGRLSAPVYSKQRIARVRLDADRPLPFPDARFDLVLIVHAPTLHLLDHLPVLVKRGGHLIVETFGAQGLNWTALPRSGEVREKLEPGMAAIRYVERQAHKGKDAVTVKGLFERR
jgi:2-polyprenyl-3-methyl-5-hydroxy-6-metoxy-1,4-benzoquinol methylase